MNYIARAYESARSPAHKPWGSLSDGQRELYTRLCRAYSKRLEKRLDVILQKVNVALCETDD